MDRGSASISRMIPAFVVRWRIFLSTTAQTSVMPYRATTIPKPRSTPTPPNIPAGPPSEAKPTVIAAAPENPDAAMAPRRTNPGTPAAAIRSTVLLNNLDFLTALQFGEPFSRVVQLLCEFFIFFPWFTVGDLEFDRPGKQNNTKRSKKPNSEQSILASAFEHCY
jgi:hypothetical protein